MPPFSSLHLYVYVFLPSFRSDAKSYGGLSIALADGYSAHSSPSKAHIHTTNSSAVSDHCTYKHRCSKLCTAVNTSHDFKKTRKHIYANRRLTESHSGSWLMSRKPMIRPGPPLRLLPVGGVPPCLVLNEPPRLCSPPGIRKSVFCRSGRLRLFSSTPARPCRLCSRPLARR